MAIDNHAAEPGQRRLVMRYRCSVAPVELVVVRPDCRPLRRRALVTKRYLARLVDVSVTGVRIELLAAPMITPGVRLTLEWSQAAAEVRIAHRYLGDDDSGLVGLGLEFKAMSDAFRRMLYETVSELRGASHEIEQAWETAR